MLSISEVRTHQKSSRDVFHLDSRHTADTEQTIDGKCGDLLSANARSIQQTHFLPFGSPKESAVQKSKAAKMVQRMKVETSGSAGNKVINEAWPSTKLRHFGVSRIKTYNVGFSTAFNTSGQKA